MKNKNSLEPWNYKDSSELYGIPYWGKDYLSVNSKGEVTISLKPESGKKISLLEIVNGIQSRGLNLPVLLRFSDILHNRIRLLNESFQNAIKEYEYKGVYRGVYPIKVNQQAEVIEEVTRVGRAYHHGLEAGSKAELIAALAYMHDPEAFIICNGYKDEEFIDLALYAKKMGIQVVIVVERPGELALIQQRARELDIKPSLGVRVKLSTKANGMWAESGGDLSLFGLTSIQILQLVDSLKKDDMLDCLELVHYHLGSQIPNISSIRSAVSEACRYYVELQKEGAKMGLLDIGGGLAVDYDGSQTNFHSSRNYTVNEYCSDIVEVIMSELKDENVPHPTIISESGRSVVAYYSVLLFNILDTNNSFSKDIKKVEEDYDHEFLTNLLEVDKGISAKNLQEAFHDAIYYRNELQSLFLHGDLSLRERGIAEEFFWKIIRKIVGETQTLKYIPEELQDLEKLNTDIYYGNFSIFQSLPDSWAINHLFPIIPIHRLNEKPVRKAVIADITCDSDGKINQFIDLHDIKKYLPLHKLKPDEDYILGAFLIGAYQETLGDLHNLFGDTNVVSIAQTDDGEFEYTQEIKGDTVAEVLSYVEYSPKELLVRFRKLAEQAIHLNKIETNERKSIMTMYEDNLRGYTYFEH